MYFTNTNPRLVDFNVQNASLPREFDLALAKGLPKSVESRMYYKKEKEKKPTTTTKTTNEPINKN